MGKVHPYHTINYTSIEHEKTCNRNLKKKNPLNFNCISMSGYEMQGKVFQMAL